MSFDRKKLRTGRLVENSFNRKFISPNAFSEKDHLTESSFNRKLSFEKWSFDRNVIWAIKLYSGRMQIQK
jgi:hypothetical protein